MRALWVTSLLVAVLLGSPAAWAHSRSASYSSWRFDGSEVSVKLALSSLDASALRARGVGRDALPAHALAALRLQSDAGPCAPDHPLLSEAREGWVDLEWELHCPSARGHRITSELLAEVNPAHLHFLRILAPNGREAVLDARSPSLELPQAESGARSFLAFVRLGVEHILTGWDHLVFVLMLMVGSRGVRRTALVVTGFTVGHSVTLTLALLGAVVVHTGTIEALIGLSIGLLAVENVWVDEGRRSAWLPMVATGSVVALGVAAALLGRASAVALVGVGGFAACYFGLVGRAERPDALRAAVAALFGLVHGFGFARVLAEMSLPPAELGRGLFGFNLGVELGQLAFVALGWWPLALLARSASRATLVRWASAAGLGLGSYWLVSRVLG